MKIPEGFGKNDDISIISFWKKRPANNNFYCYHYFYIKDLIERDDKSLFETENEKLFLVYKNSNSSHDLALLNLDIQINELNRPLIAHDHISTNAFNQVLELTNPKFD